MSVETALQKFVRIPLKDDKRKGDDIIQTHNGVQCAMDGYRAGIILPDGLDDWDLKDAYLDYVILKEKNVEVKKAKKKEQSIITVEEPHIFDLSRTFEDSVRFLEGFLIDKQDVKRLINSCKELQAEHMKYRSTLPSKSKTPQNKYGKIFIDIDGMKVISENDAKMLANNISSKVICFNIKYLRDTLEFIKYAKDDVWIWYRSSITPLVMKSGNLYALVSPVRIV